MASKSEYDKEYNRTHTTSCSFRLNNERDADLIEIYRSIPNKAEWFENCLREYKKRSD